MGDDAAVLFIETDGGSAGGRLAPSYRGFCGLPAAYANEPSAAFVEGLRADWQQRGRELWLLSLSPQLLQEYSAIPASDLIVGRYDLLEMTFTRRPRSVVPFGVGVYGAPAQPTG